MRIGWRRVTGCLPVLLIAGVLPACGADGGAESQPVTNRASATTAVTADNVVAEGSSTTTVPASSTQVLRSEKWIDLAVGDCLADPPPSDPGVVTVSIVDCAAAHQAEVYSRAPVGVNAAVADVANRECATGLTDYTGQSVADSPFAVTYLIDSSQNRTSDNPMPSTVICLLRAADSQPLIGSARALNR